MMRSCVSERTCIPLVYYTHPLTFRNEDVPNWSFDHRREEYQQVFSNR